jgi:hypothetical protein
MIRLLVDYLTPPGFFIYNKGKGLGSVGDLGLSVLRAQGSLSSAEESKRWAVKIGLVDHMTLQMRREG